MAGPYSPGVFEFIIFNSNRIMTTPAQAAIPNRRCARRLLDCIHTSRCNTPKARQVPAAMDQMTVIQLMPGRILAAGRTGLKAAALAAAERGADAAGNRCPAALKRLK